MYGILNTGAVTTDIFITPTCGDTMTTENNAKNNKNVRFKSVNLKKYYKQNI